MALRWGEDPYISPLQQDVGREVICEECGFSATIYSRFAIQHLAEDHEDC